MPEKPLLKALTEAGIGSRRRMADAIKRGAVEINGKTAEDFNLPVNIDTDRVSVYGQPAVLKPEETICLMLHKPEGILSTVSDERGRRTVVDILPRKYRRYRLYPVGRLDRESSGLMLLTNDGNLTYRLTHPRFEHEKEYLVHINGRLGPDEKSSLEQGLELEDGMTYPAVVKEATSLPPFNYSITIHEGRKRQVRRMFASLGYRVMKLKRVRIGRLSLGELKESEVHQLSADEVSALLDPGP